MGGQEMIHCQASVAKAGLFLGATTAVNLLAQVLPSVGDAEKATLQWALLVAVAVLGYVVRVQYVENRAREGKFGEVIEKQAAQAAEMLAAMRENTEATRELTEVTRKGR